MRPGANRDHGANPSPGPLVRKGGPLRGPATIPMDKPKSKHKSGPSGPSGKNKVTQRAVRIPDDLWARFGTVAAEQNSDRNAIVNQLVAEYCARLGR